MCAAGIVDGYWEYRLKPWDVAAGVLIAEEAGALVTTMEGKPFSVKPAFNPRQPPAHAACSGWHGTRPVHTMLDG